jgi:transposase InsO family protein
MRIRQSESRSINELCSLLGYSRQAFYQYQRQSEKEALQYDLLIQEVLEIRRLQKRIGTRKLFHMTVVFRELHGIVIGRDAFFGLLSGHGLLIRKRRRKKPLTTFSNHWLRKHPNLIIGFIPLGPNQLWVADITYIDLEDGHAYLSLITDAYSRKIVGFYLSVELTAEGCIEALKMAFKNNPERNKLIHHSDRGVQYCSSKYVGLLNKNTVRISMTQSGDPKENAIAERVNGILKEELLEASYRNFKEAQEAIAKAVSVYNHFRPHGSIDMLTPAEAHQGEGELKKRWKNHYAIKNRKEINMG